MLLEPMFSTWSEQKCYEVWINHMVKLCDLW